MWNSGRFASMIATMSPRPTPSFARPPATASTRPSSSDHVSDTLSSRPADGDDVRVVGRRATKGLRQRRGIDRRAGRRCDRAAFPSSSLVTCNSERIAATSAIGAGGSTRRSGDDAARPVTRTLKPVPDSVEMSLLRPITKISDDQHESRRRPRAPSRRTGSGGRGPSRPPPRTRGRRRAAGTGTG